MTPCPICNQKIKRGDGKRFPIGLNRIKYSIAFGVDIKTFSNILTDRYMCWSHFQQEAFENCHDEKKKLKRGALPKPLTLNEKEALKISAARFYKLKRNLQKTELSQNKISLDNDYADIKSTLKDNKNACNIDTQNSTSEIYKDSEMADIEDNPSKNIATNSNNFEFKEKYEFVIVQVSKLLELLCRCQNCGHKPLNAKPKLHFNLGIACRSTLWCQKCEKCSEWQSQEFLYGAKRYSGNVILPSAAATVPLDYASIKELFETAKIPFISHQKFFEVSRAVWKQVKQTYEIMQNWMVENLKEKLLNGELLHIAADGQWDTRGHKAYLCAVTFMDAETKFILHSVCLHKSQTNNISSQMEVKGMVNGIRQITEKFGLKISSLITDRSKVVISKVKENFPEIKHYYDSWHFIKAVVKNIKKECEKAKIPMIPKNELKQHLGWAITTANGDGILCQELILSILLHLIGIHEWHEGKVLAIFEQHQIPIGSLKGKIIKYLEFRCPQKCMQTLIVSPQIYLAVTSPAFNVLLKIFTIDQFLHDASRVSPLLSTSALESFHGLVGKKYRSKQKYYPLESFESRTLLAILHHNHNILDEISGKRKIIQQQNIISGCCDSPPKKVIKTPPNFSWKRKDIVEAVIDTF